MVHDQIRGIVVPARQDIIKIKGHGGTWACRCWDPVASSCRIYAERPLECRALECWNTAGIQRVYARSRLTRRDLLAGMEGVWSAVEEHQRRCDHRRIRKLLAAAHGKGAERHQRELTDIIRYDAELRRRVLARIGLEASMLDFLFGRPLPKTLRALQAGMQRAVRPRAQACGGRRGRLYFFSFL
jgi:Fe-S-cluster containining protein